MERLTEGEDYYIDKKGLLVFSAKYLLDRGSCCGNGCRHCPFDYKNVAEPERSKLLSLREDEKFKK
jgi:2-iminoacetate synthase ThiH